MPLQHKEKATDHNNIDDQEIWPVQFFSNILRRLAELKPGMFLDDESLTNLAEFNQILASAPGIIYGNHQSMLDLGVAKLMKLLPNRKRVIVPMAEKWAVTNDKKKLSRLSALVAKKLGERFGVSFFPVPQNKKKEKVNGESTIEVSTDLVNTSDRTNELIKALDDAMKEPGNVFGVTPEGKRTKPLGKFKDSLAIECLKHPNAWVLPIAITYVGLGMHVSIGKPFLVSEMLPNQLQQINALELSGQNKTDSYDLRHKIYDEVSDILGKTLAAMLPPELRGDYKIDN